MRWKRRSPGRRELVAQKRRLEDEIRAATADLRGAQRRGTDTGVVERRLAELRDRHYQTRLAIDRADLDS